MGTSSLRSSNLSDLKIYTQGPKADCFNTQLSTYRTRIVDEFPRVDRYIVDTMLCFARGDRFPVLDPNVARVYSRVFRDIWPEMEEDQLTFTQRLVPDEAYVYNLALLDSGALSCQA